MFEGCAGCCDGSIHVVHISRVDGGDFGFVAGPNQRPSISPFQTYAGSIEVILLPDMDLTNSFSMKRPVG